MWNSSKLAVAIGSGYCFHSTRVSFPTSTWILKPEDHGSSPCSVTIFGLSNKWPSDFSLGCLDELAGAAAPASVEGTVSETASGGTFFSDFLSPHGKSCTTNQLPQELTASVHRQLATKLRPFSAHTLCPLLLSSLSSCSVKETATGGGIPLMKHSIVMHPASLWPYLTHPSATCTENGGLWCLRRTPSDSVDVCKIG